VHPFGDLSAYLDGALSSEARALVQAHLDTCALCRTRLAELRGTARLIAALPAPVPSRSLVPRVSVPFWLAPLRTFSTLASAAAIFLFVASAALSVFPRAISQSAPAAAPAASAALDAARGGATSATATPASDTKLATPPSSSPSGLPGAAFNVAPTAAPAPAERSAAKSDAAATRTDLASSSPSAGLERVRYSSTGERPPFSPFPWLWLVLGVAFAALSLVLGRRLRSA
jgi:hypothetical protein